MNTINQCVFPSQQSDNPIIPLIQDIELLNSKELGSSDPGAILKIQK